MLADYRAWLESELQLLGNASHHAYSFGQANMAKRAIEKLDEEFAANVYVAIDKTEARRALTALEAIGEQSTSLEPNLDVLRDAIRTALIEADPPAA
ncbi:MAG: hypothetical protein ABR591_07900 [Candidatus Velthaea sp.]